MDWTNETNVLKALILLYNLQTQDEKISQGTHVLNGVGFTASNARFLTDVAQRLLIEKKGISRKTLEAVKVAMNVHGPQIDRFGLEGIELPETAIVYEPKKRLEGDGLARIRDDELEFVPNVYPSNQIKPFGFTWNKYGQKSWTSVLAIEKVGILQEHFHDLVIDHELQEWVENVDNFNLVDIDESLVSGSVKDFQELAIRFMVKSDHSLLALAPGLGKTLCAIHAAMQKGGRTLIVCPLTLTVNWRNEIRKWAGADQTIAIWHQGTSYPDEDWIITNYETVLKQLVLYDEVEVEKNGRMIKEKKNWRSAYDLHNFFENLIIDESILIKNREAQRSNACMAISKEFQNVWLLSGSPTSRFYDDLWFQFHLLDKERFRGYWGFARQYCEVETTSWGTSVKGNKPNAHAEIINNYRDIYFCRTQDQVIDLPPWIFDDVLIDMLPKQTKMYDQMEEEFRAELPEGDEILAFNILAQMTRLIQIASNPLLIGGPNEGAKWDAAVEMLGYEELPAIVWTNYIQTVNLVSERLKRAKFKVATLFGETKQEERQETVDKFQKGDLDVIIAHPKVGKFGLTLTRARTAIYLERSYDGDDYYQSLYRVRRIGTTQSPHVIHLISSHPTSESVTIDTVIGRVLTYRKDSSFKLTSGLIRSAYAGDLK